MLRDVRITFFGGPRAKGREAYFLRFQGRGLTTRKIDACTFVAKFDTLGQKEREAYFLKFQAGGGLTTRKINACTFVAK